MFITHGPVSPDSPLFIGREKELAKLEAWFSHTNFVGLVLGARQTGKTSLLLKSRHLNQTKYQCVFINLEAITGAPDHECYQFIAEEILEQLDFGHEEKLNEIRIPNNSQKFLSFLRELSKKSLSIRIVILLDEIGSLTPDSAIKLGHSIRAVFTNRYVQPEYQRFSFVLSGASDLLQLTTGHNSPLKNVTESIYLTDLSYTETQTLLITGFTQSKLNTSSSVIDRIYHWTSGHPYLTQLLANFILSAKHILSEEEVDQLVELCWQIEDRNLPHLFRSIEGKNPDIWSIIKSVQDDKPPPFSRSNTHIAELELMGAIKNDNGYCKIRNNFYAEAIRRHEQSNNHNMLNVTESRYLYQMLCDYWNEEELRDICFMLDVDYDNLPAQGKNHKARELVKYLDARERLAELSALCRKSHPHLFS